MLSLYAKGLTTGRSPPLRRALRRQDLPDTISRITDKVLADMAEWTARPLRLRRNLHRRAERESARRSGRQPTVLRRDRVDLAGHKDVLGLWAGDGAGNQPSSGSPY
ncbi:transposase, Mutator family protein [Mycobacterium intracellulare MIN_061107_1834]|nr:transposase, Mutator family protein [Mycobacterium intracellulare MIN_061107_1834]